MIRPRRIEERYFTDPAFFKEVRDREMYLICQFIHGKLTEEERGYFERRYLQIPRLRELVERVRGALTDVSKK